MINAAASLATGDIRNQNPSRSEINDEIKVVAAHPRKRGNIVLRRCRSHRSAGMRGRQQAFDYFACSSSLDAGASPAG